MEIRGTRVARGFVQGRVRRPHAFAGIRIACPGSRACGVFGVSRPRGALPVGGWRGSRARGPRMDPRLLDAGAKARRNTCVLFPSRCGHPRMYARARRSTWPRAEVSQERGAVQCGSLFIVLRLPLGPQNIFVESRGAVQGLPGQPHAGPLREHPAGGATGANRNSHRTGKDTLPRMF